MSSIHDALRQTGRTSGPPIQSPPDRRPASARRSWPYTLVVAVMVLATIAAVVWFLGLASHIIKPEERIKTIHEAEIIKSKIMGEKLTPPSSQVTVKTNTSKPMVVKLSPPGSQPAEERRSNELPAGPQPALPAGSPAWPGRETAAETPSPGIPEPPQVPTMEEPAVEQPGAMDHFQEARSAHERGDLNLAVYHYRRALDLDPNLAGAFLNLGNIYLFERSQPELAREMFDHVLSLEPNNKLAYNNLGVLNMREGRLPEAEKYLAAALEKDPTFVEAVYNLACLSARQGRNSLAMSYLKKAGRLTPDAAAWAREDEDLKSLRDLPEFQRFLTEAPEKEDAHKDDTDG